MSGPKIRRLYYSAREVCSRLGISQVALRNWEHKFPQFKPARSQSGRKLYKPSDLKLILRLKQYKEAGYTDEKIASILWPQLQHIDTNTPEKSPPTKKIINGIKNELKDILSLIDSTTDTKRSAST
ncbi:MerR family transcriptional regulator [candidate division KSB1 bacterium]|nr:MerR family transcriptional regulator [candidate division KSB1 bacterium]